jgi:predicted Zn-dependent protease
MNKPADAQAAYRAALEIVPGAHAATMALAALLTTQNQRIEAAAAIDRLIASNRSVADPWWSYWPGDFRFVDNLLLQLREAVR